MPRVVVDWESKERKPWERQKYESRQCYALFCAYRDMPPRTRSLITAYRAVYDKPNARSIPGYCAVWRTSNAFVRRAQLHDEHLDKLARQATENAIKEQATLWAQRRDVIRDDAWDSAQRLLGKARQMLEFPLATTHTKDGKTIVKPARWSFADVGRYLEICEKLRRLSAEMATEKTQIDVVGVDMVLAALPAEVRELVEQQLRKAVQEGSVGE